MRLIFTILAAMALSGCVTRASLIAADGPRYEMGVDPVGRRLTTNIDGVAYTGTYTRDTMTGFGSAQTYSMRPANNTTSFGTVTYAGSNGQALLTGANGGYIECAFSVNGVVVIGKCQSNTGRQFVLTTD
jgi:hypothetical protein